MPFSCRRSFPPCVIPRQAAIWLLRFSVPLTIRPPTIDELSGLSDLCFRSKAVWGYDEEFMEACRGELSFEPRDLELTPIAVAEHDGKRNRCCTAKSRR